MVTPSVCSVIASLSILAAAAPAAAAAEPAVVAQERYVQGEGDAAWLRLLDTAARVFRPDPELQDLGMLYSPAWNGLVEGPTWGAWWIQNSYGPTYCALPYLQEPFVTFLQNSQDLWFSQMGDGKRAGFKDWVAPDGCLCDAAAPDWIVYKQGDGRIDIHDWGMEFTAAGVVMQAELLLISRDRAAIDRYLPLLERCADFLESRRDPQNDLFLAGPAGNLLAPSYAGQRRPDGTYGMAYLTGLSVTTIAALDRLVELETLAGRQDRAALFRERGDRARRGLARLTTEDGYLIKYLDPDGTRHGVHGAAQYGYFEAVCNHDAVALRVVDDAQARRIYDRMCAIPGLRPHDVVITNSPSLDDMYENPAGLWGFGTWVNGGHWTTCEARMILGYFRVGRYDDARRAWEHILTFYRQFRTDNPLVEFGAAPYQPKQPINCVYDTWGAPAGVLRGLFEYLYRADGLTLVPHIPPAIRRLEQRFPVRFGNARLFITVCGQGPVTGAWLNGEPCPGVTPDRVFLPADRLTGTVQVTLGLGGAQPAAHTPRQEPATQPVPPTGDPFWSLAGYLPVDSGNLGPLRIGIDSLGGSRFLGLLRRTRVFARELPPQEVAALAANPGADAPAPGPGPLLDYVLDGATAGTVANRAGAEFAAKVVGDLAFEDSPHGRVARFAGKGHLEVAFDPRLNLPGPYSLDAWICPDALPGGGGRILDKVTAGVDDGYLLDTFPGNSLRFITERGHLGHAAELTPGQWVHVAATFSPTGSLRLYVQGRPVAAAPTGPPPRPAWEAVGRFLERLRATGEGGSYEARHAELVLDYLTAIHTRHQLRETGRLPALPPASQAAADKSYADAMDRLVQGLRKVMDTYATSTDPRQQRLAAAWAQGRTWR